VNVPGAFQLQKTITVMRKTFILVLILLCFTTAKSQCIDRYGLRIGAGLSNQDWEYKNNQFIGLSGWNDNLLGFIGQFYAEKDVGNYWSFRSAIGYIQKGFIGDITLATPDDNILLDKRYKLFVHDLFMDLTLKIMPFKGTIRPFLSAGLRGDYLLDIRSKILVLNNKLEPGLDDEFNKFSMGAILGVGMMYGESFIFELEYNPAITKAYESDKLAVTDRCFCLTIGLNINSFLHRKE